MPNKPAVTHDEIQVRDPMAHPLSPRRPATAARPVYTIEDLPEEMETFREPARLVPAGQSEPGPRPVPSTIEPREPEAYPHLPLRPRA